MKKITFFHEYLINTCIVSKTKLLYLVMFITTCSFSQIYVNGSATGANNGNSWTDAYTDLQSALANMNAGDEIWIASGTYKPAISNRSTYFTINQPNIKIYGGFAGTETAVTDRVLGANETILSGDLNGDDVNVVGFASNYVNSTRNTDNSYRVVSIASTGENLLLDGLTISDAHTNVSTTTVGGAIIKDDSVNNLTLRSCIIKDNVSRNSCAGLFVDFNLGNVNTTRGSLVIDRCQFTNNMSRGGSGIYGLIRSSTNVDITIANSVFDLNITDDLNTNDKGISGSSAWLRTVGNNSDATLNIYNNTYVNNIDKGTLGGIVDDSYRSTLLISENGGITSNIIGEVANCIFWNNTGLNDNPNTNGLTSAISDAFELPITSLNVYNSIDPLNFTDSSITSVVNTMTTDPLFTDLVNGDYTLSSSSVAIDSGDNSKRYGSKDILNNSRIFNGFMDLGAYEFGSNPNTTIKFYVNLNATGFNNGTSWTDAYTDLQSALAIVFDGDEIWIASGTYKPSVSDRGTFYRINKSNISIYGGFAGTETVITDRIIGANETILSGDLNGDDINVSGFFNNYSNGTRNTDNTYRVIAIDALGENLLLDGLTISDAHNNASSTSPGAAILKDDSVNNLTLRNCILRNNVARNFSAGLHADFNLANTNGTRGSLVIDRCQFINNMSRAGSGIYALIRANTNMDITVTNSVFANNLAGDLTTTVLGSSGSSVWLRTIGNGSDAKLNVYNNIFVDNKDSSTNSGIIDDRFRAPLLISESASIFSNIVGEVANCIFWNNTGLSDAASTGGLTRAITDTFENPIPSLIVYNSLDPLNFVDGSITNAVNTITTDPFFTDSANGDYTLTSGSTAIDTGDNTYVFGTEDILGNQRVFNTTVDMGAYEFGSVALSNNDFDLQTNDIKLYPVPVASILNIKTNGFQVEKVTIYNALGQQVLQTKDIQIPVSKLENGIYILKAKTTSGNIVKRFIKQ